MANTIDKEVVIAYVADIGGLKPVVDIQQKIGEKFQRIHEEEKIASEKASQKIISDRKKINEAFQKNIDIIREETATIQQAEKIFESFRKSGEKAFDNKKIVEFTKKLKSEFDKIINLSKFSIKFDDNELKTLSALVNSTDNTFEQLSITISAIQGKLDSLDYKDENAQKLSDELKNLKPQVEALATYFDETAEASAISLNQIKTEIESVKEYIIQSENELKALDNQIESTAPGKDQAGLIQDRNKLNQSLEEAKLNLEGLTQEYKTLETETKNAEKAQKSLGSELRQVKDELVRLELEGKENTEQYEQLKNKATELQKSIKDVNDEIKHSASNTAGINSVIGAVSGLVAVYELAEATSVLFGEEQEELHETLVRLTSVMAILQGLQEIQNQLTEKTTLANKALIWTQNQYRIATDASAKATLRFGAAMKLIGIGLIVGALAAAVVYWKDIAKWMGITSEEVEKNAAITEKSNELYGEQIAKLTILVKRVKEGGLSFKEKKEAVKQFNDEFGKTLGSAKDYLELEKRLIENGEVYIKYLGLKAKAEAAYQLAVEEQRDVIKESISLSEEGVKGLSKITNAYEKYTQGRAGRNAKSTITEEDISTALGLPTESEVDNFLSDYTSTIQKKVKDLWERAQKASGYVGVFGNISSEAEELAKLYNIVGDEADKNSKKAAKATKDWAAEIKKLVAELIKAKEGYAVSLIGNDREREIEQRKLQFQQEKQGLQDQIDAIKVSNDKKLELQALFNDLYNEENGLAYEAFQKDIAGINEKYSNQAEEVRLKALMAIREVNVKTTAVELQAIKDRWAQIRKGLEKELKLTNDVVEQAKIRKTINETVSAQKTEENKFLLGKENEELELQQQIINKMISIWAIGNRKLAGNEKLIQTQRLLTQKIIFEQMLDNQKKYLDDSQKLFLDDIVNKIMGLGSNVSPEQWVEIAKQLNDVFDPETAKRILEIIQNLKDVNNEVDELKKSTPGLEGWFTSTKDFAKKIGELLKFEGKELTFFSETVGMAISTMWNATSQIMAQNVQDHQNRLSEIENLISQTESELEREKELYEQGYANNYELKKKELEDLKKQKAEEKKELEKAQKIQQAMNQASILSNLAATSISLVKSAAQVMEGSTKIPIVGVALGIGLIAAMMAAMMAMKSQAQSFASYRTGLEQGPLMLNGPSHERGGMGLYDSASGRKVAEYEGGEHLYALNNGQQSKYGWLMQAMIDDAKGRTPIMSSLMSKIPVTGKKTLAKVRQVNEITRSAQKKRAEASNENREMLNEMKKFNKNFEREFGGFKNRETEKTEFWETPNHFYVKKSGITKKYRKTPEN